MAKFYFHNMPTHNLNRVLSNRLDALNYNEIFRSLFQAFSPLSVLHGKNKFGVEFPESYTWKTHYKDHI